MTHKTLYVVMFLSTVIPTIVEGHDTTHIHPLITSKIAELIQQKDSISKNYEEIYAPIPDTNPIKLLYWGTDFDPNELNGKTDAEKEIILGKDQTEPYLNGVLSGYSPIEKNVITGVVYEDVPFTKVLNHFYHAKDGSPLGIPLSKDSATRAMTFFNQSIEAMGGYTKEAKEEAFFLFGQALHHVEDMITPAHIHNDVENVLFVPMRRYGQLKNTHVAHSTLRFLNSPCLALKQTELFHGFTS